jgi:alpha-ketoglutarate-dependent taurine dioxygenase
MFLDAVASFEGYLAEDHRRLEFKMAEGDLVFFDNRRVLHARRAFRNWTDEEKQRMGIDVHAGDEPQRWLKGCYLDGDTVWDKLVTLMSGESARVRKDPNTRTRS